MRGAEANPRAVGAEDDVEQQMGVGEPPPYAGVALILAGYG